MEQPFDWAAWDAQFDRQQLALADSLARWNEAERALAQAGLDMVQVLRRIMAEAINA